MSRLFSLIAIAFFALQSTAMDVPMQRKTKLNHGFEFHTLGSFEEGFIEFLQSQPENERNVLEIGGGYGRLALKTIGLVKGVNYIFTDLSTEQVAEAHARAESTKLASDARFTSRAFDCTKDPFDFDDESLDAVMIANVFHFLTPSAVIHVIESLQPKLKQNGRIYVMTQTPYFVFQDHLAVLEEEDKAIAEQRKKRNRRLDELEKSTGQAMQNPGLLKSLCEEALELDRILDDIVRQQERLKPTRNNVYWAAVFSELHRIYMAQGIPFPGCRSQALLGGVHCDAPGKFSKQNIMTGDYGISMRAKDLTALVSPFGFSLESHREYIIRESLTEEVEQGAYLGMSFAKNGNVDAEQVLTLKSTALSVFEQQAAFHEGRVVEYFDQFPYIKIGKKCDRTNCQKVGGQKCGRCKKQTYCSRDCQVVDWSTHKGSCVTANTNTTLK